MIDKIKLINFQSHKNRDIHLDQEVTTLLGPSDVGKTAILRALYWLCFNKPGGDDFIHHEAEKASVHLFVDDHEIERHRGKSDNYYVLDEKKYKAMGKNVPEEIQQILKVDGINFQLQHDAPFWITLSPGELAREVNKIVNLELIDKVMSLTASEIRKNKMEQSIREESIAESTRELQQLQWLQDCQKSYQELCELEEKRNTVERKREVLEPLWIRYQQLKKRSQHQQEFQQDSNKILSLLKKQEQQRTQEKQLSSLHSEHERLKQKWENLNQEIIKTKEILKKHAPKYCPKCKQRLPT